MKKLMLGMAATSACHVGNVEAAQWMSFDAVNEGREGDLIRTNEGHVICAGKPGVTEPSSFSYSPVDTRYWNGSAANWGSERKRLSTPDNPTVHSPESVEV